MSQDYSITCKTCENQGIYNLYSDEGLRRTEAIDIVKDIRLIASIAELKCNMLSAIEIKINFSYSTSELLEYSKIHKDCKHFLVVSEYGTDFIDVFIGESNE